MVKQLFNGPLRDFLRNLRDGGIRSAVEFLKSPRIRYYFPRLLDIACPDAVEVHILTGRARVTMGLWMIASWITATHRAWHFVIHDDGTLSQSDAGRLAELLPGSRVVLRSEADARSTKALKAFPLCLRCREIHPFCKRIFDFPLFSSNDRFLSIDTDVLFFATPHRLMQWVSEERPPFVFLKDLKDTSLLIADDFERRYQKLLVGDINAGIAAVPKIAVAPAIFESLLTQFDLFNADKWFIEQTFLAAAASIYGHFELLPADFVMTLAQKCPTSAVARHYVGAIRHLFYSEGISRVEPLLRGTAVA